MATKYKVTLPDGSVATRKTERVYSHIVAIRVDSATNDPKWEAVTWCGRPDLAERQKSQWLVKIGRRVGCDGRIADVTIVAVDQ